MDTSIYKSLCIVTPSEIRKCKYDKKGLKYSSDGKKLIKCNATSEHYEIKKGVEIICKGAFRSNKYVKSVILPSSVKYIGCEAFRGCTSLSKITIPQGTIYIGENAFYSTFIEEVDLSLSLIEGIEPGSFHNCKQLKSVLFPKQIKYIGENAFSGSDLKFIDLSDTNVINIRKKAFYSTHAKEILLPSCLTQIEDEAFALTEIKSIDIPENVEFLGKFAFVSSNLKAAELPLKLKEIRPNAITRDYYRDQEIKLSSNSPEFIIYGKGILNKDRTILYDCLSNDYKIPATIKEIMPYCFSGCNGEITFCKTSTIEHIGDDVFNDTELNQLTIPNTVKEIGNRAFLQNGFSIFKIPDLVKTIGDEAFKGCWNLKYVYIPGSIEHIGKDVFEECDALDAIVVPLGNKDKIKTLIPLYEELISEGNFEDFIDKIEDDSTNIGIEGELWDETDDDDIEDEDYDNNDDKDDSYYIDDDDDNYYLAENLQLEIISDITARKTGLNISNIKVNATDYYEVEIQFNVKGKIKENFELSVAIYDDENKIRATEDIEYFYIEEDNKRFTKKFNSCIETNVYYKKIKKIRFYLG